MLGWGNIDAERYYRRSIAILENKLGPDDLNTISAQEHLAALYIDTARLEKASPSCAQACAYRKQGSDGPCDIAETLLQLGTLHVLHRRYADGELLFREAFGDLHKASRRGQRQSFRSAH